MWIALLNVLVASNVLAQGFNVGLMDGPVVGNHNAFLSPVDDLYVICPNPGTDLKSVRSLDGQRGVKTFIGVPTIQPVSQWRSGEPLGFSSTGSVFYTFTTEGLTRKVMAWDTKTGRKTDSVTMLCNEVRLSGDRDHLLVRRPVEGQAGFDSILVYHFASQMQKLLGVFEMARMSCDRVNAFAYLMIGNQVRLFDLEEGVWRADISLGTRHVQSIDYRIATSGDGSTMYFQTDDGNIHVYDVQQQAFSRIHELQIEIANGFTLSADEQEILIPAFSSVLTLDVASGNKSIVFEAQDYFRHPIYDAQYVFDGSRIIIDRASHASVIDKDGTNQRLLALKCNAYQIRCVRGGILQLNGGNILDYDLAINVLNESVPSLIPAQGYLTSSQGHTFSTSATSLRIHAPDSWNVVDSTPIASVFETTTDYCAARRLVVSFRDSSVRITDCATGVVVGSVDAAAYGHVDHAQFSSDRRFVSVLCENGMIRVDVASAMQELRVKQLDGRGTIEPLYLNERLQDATGTTLC